MSIEKQLPFSPLSQAAEDDEAKALVAVLDEAAAGILFTSESDYAYRAFSVALDAETPLDLGVLRTVLPWIGGPAAPDWTPPAILRVEARAHDSFWLDQTVRMPHDATSHRTLDRLMKASFVPTSIQGAPGAAVARIFTATLPEQDAAVAPYFVFGRLASGHVVGLRTYRVWT